MRLLSSAIDAFRQAELREGEEALQLLATEDELASLSDSDVDDSGGSDEDQC